GTEREQVVSLVLGRRAEPGRLVPGRRDPVEAQPGEPERVPLVLGDEVRRPGAYRDRVVGQRGRLAAEYHGDARQAGGAGEVAEHLRRGIRAVVEELDQREAVLGRDLAEAAQLLRGREVVRYPRIGGDQHAADALDAAD